MKKFWEKYCLNISIIFFLITTILLIYLSFNLCERHLIYALDDAYIHMAIAKNFASNGVWGITRYGFTSTSSSILWTLLISLTYLIFGVNEFSPLILNLTVAILLIFTLYKILKSENLKEKYILLTIITIILLTPLYPLILSGQEHLLQILIDLLFIYYASKTTTEENIKYEKHLIILSPFLTSIRYEGLFILFVVSFIFFTIHKKRTLATKIFLMGLLPITIYGIISISNGWAFLPNSILMKGNSPKIESLKDIFTYSLSWLKTLITAPQLLMVTLIILICAILLRREKRELVLFTIFLPVIILHAQFSRTGWLYRYEAYLMAISIFITAIYLEKISTIKISTRGKSVLITLITIFSILLLFRGIYGTRRAIFATKNIYEQQYQMGLFLKEFYSKKPVALNDIGAANFLADIKCVDLCGLANMKVKIISNKHIYTLINLKELISKNEVEIAIIFKKWFKKGIPHDWIEVGSWKIKNNVICGDDKITFFGIGSKNAKILIKNLKKFKDKLPSDVIQSGIYIN